MTGHDRRSSASGRPADRVPAASGAVVTGAGRGIGRAVAEALASRGHHVVLAARTTHEIESVATAIGASGGRATAVPADVSDADSVLALARAAEDAAGPIEVLVNNAGIGSSAPLARIELDEWNRVMAVNATGAFLCIRAFAPSMAARGYGRIVNVASVAALTGAPYTATYAASKHAVMGVTRSVAAELAPRGVTVNAVCPGYVDTAMTDETLDRIVEKTDLSREAALESILSSARHRRLVTVTEVAHVVTMLAHENAGSVIGQAIVVDGGGLLS